MNKKYCVLFLMAIAHNVYGAGPGNNVTELNVYISPEFNRTFYFCWDLAVTGSIMSKNLHNIHGGLAVGTAGREPEIKAFTRGEAVLSTRVPFTVSFAYMYNGLPGYEVHTHTALPLLSLKGRRAGCSFGTSLRFTSFFGEPAVFEPIWSFSGYVHIIYTNSLRAGFSAANFTDFTAGSLGSYFIALTSRVYLNRGIALVNDIEAYQSGSLALAANLYRIVYRGGVTFSW